MKKRISWGMLLGILFILGIGLRFIFSFLDEERSVHILSSSMSPEYEGPAWRLNCPKCGETFLLTVDYPFGEKRASARWAECPKCGFSEVPVTDEFFQEGERVRIKSQWEDFSSPKRWEAAAFKLPKDEGGNGGEMSSAHLWTFKRIVGLSGESVRIDRGDLWINGKIVSKDEFWQKRDLPLPHLTLTPVFLKDRVLFQNLRPLPYLEGENPESANSFDFSSKRPVPIQNLPPSPRLEPIAEDRLENVRDFIIEIPFALLDNLSLKDTPFSLLINQGDYWGRLDLSRGNLSIGFMKNPRPEEGEELFFSLTASSFDSARFLPIKLPKIALDTQNKDKQDQGNQDKDEQNEMSEKTGEFLRLVFCDRRVLCQIVDFKGVRGIAEFREDVWGDSVDSPSSLKNETPKENLTITTPFALLGRGETNSEDFRESLSSIRFYRDIHYSAGDGETSAFTIPKGEYLLLGDNSAVSWDARHWKKKTVPRSKIRKIKKIKGSQNPDF